jgi:large repetitive protein
MIRCALILLSLVMLVPIAQAAESPYARTTNVTAHRLQLGPQESYLLSIPSGLVIRHMEFDFLLGSAFQGSALIVTNEDSGRFKRSLLGAQSRFDLSLSLGLYNRFEFGLRLPMINGQSTQYIGLGLESPPQSSGLGDAQIMSTMQHLSNRSGPFNLASTLTITLPTGDEESYGSRGSIGAELRTTLSRWVNSFLAAASFGYQYQAEIGLPDQTDGPRLRGGVGAEYLLPTQSTDHRVTAELDGYMPTSNFDARQSGLVAGIGYGVAAYDHWQFGAQFHGALTDSFGLPAYHGMFSVGYRHLTHRRAPRCVNDQSYLHDDRCDPPDTDNDGVFDTVDVCPKDAEDIDKFEDEDGCPDLDNDKDGLLDASDSCPNEPEDVDTFEDDDGCPDPDNDKDEIMDTADKCPLDPETKNGFDDEDGCPEPDDDGDTIPNAYDRCPSEPEDKDGFNDKDGCPDPDNDGDGILDGDDLCPNEPEDKNGVRDEDGCPDAILAVKTSEEIVITNKILFIHGQVIPRKISRPILSAVKDILVNHPSLYVQIEGHTDDYGGTDFNRYLSQARAQAVLDAIVRVSGQGHQLRGRLTAVGFGKVNPAASNQTKEGRARNRRVIFRIMSQ